VIGLTCYLYTLEARLPRLLPPVENYRYRLFIILAYPYSLCRVADPGRLSRILIFLHLGPQISDPATKRGRKK
jgi:hypothetical protein